MWHGKVQLLFDLVTREALLIWNGGVHRLERPFPSTLNAEEAAEQLKRRVIDASPYKIA